MTNTSSEVAPAVSGYGSPMSTCYACGRDWGGGMACQFCRQVGGLPSGVRIASAGKRLGGFLLEGLLFVVTAGVGWLVWSLIVYKNGQTPAKQILGMRIVSTGTNCSASWGTTALREVVGKPVIGVLAAFTLYIAYFWLLWDPNNQELWDKMFGTFVVDDPNRVVPISTGGIADPLRGLPPRALPGVAAGVVALLVGLAAFAVVEVVRTPASSAASAAGTPDRASDAARQSALNAANLVAVNFTTLDYRHLTQDFQRLAALATPSFRSAYLTQTNAAAEYIVRFKGRSTGTVVASAVQNATPTNAEVIAAVNDTIVNTKYPNGTLRYFRLDIKLSRMHGKWLVNTVDPV